MAGLVMFTACANFISDCILSLMWAMAGSVLITACKKFIGDWLDFKARTAKEKNAVSDDHKPCSNALAMVEINEVLLEIMPDIAANMFTSDIWNFSCACKHFRYSGVLAHTDKILCTNATMMIIASGFPEFQDEALEYLASGELRQDHDMGCLTFDDLCYLQF